METGNNTLDSVGSKSEYFDLTYSSEPASYYYLILEIDSFQIKALWYHFAKNLVTGFATYPIGQRSLESVLNEHSFLSSEFKEVLVLSRGNNYLPVPKNLITQNRQEVFSYTNAFDPDSEVLRHYDLVNLSAEIIFPIDEKKDVVLHKAFKHMRIIPHVAPRIEEELNRHKHEQSDILFISHVTNDFVDIRVYKDGKPILINSFFQSGKEDIAYYILYVSEVLEVDPEKVVLNLDGTIEIGDQTWNLLQKYWKCMKLTAPLTHVQISQKLEGYSKSQYDYLTHGLLCVS